ncbi:MAG: hypothetical protein IT495_15040 [Gammaproteobacteria bacterium]|nr:hypothetical protein [Gammaproteobacteria bacterium]
MRNVSRNVLRVSALALVLGLATGCSTVTKEQFDAVSSTANNALSEARAAKSSADAAMSAAKQAQSAAEGAQRTADEALACCRDNSDKIERLFEKTMRK